MSKILWRKCPVCGVSSHYKIYDEISQATQDERKRVLDKLGEIMDVKLFRILKKELKEGAGDE